MIMKRVCTPQSAEPGEAPLGFSRGTQARGPLPGHAGTPAGSRREVHKESSNCGHRKGLQSHPAHSGGHSLYRLHVSGTAQ